MPEVVETAAVAMHTPPTRSWFQLGMK